MAEISVIVPVYRAEAYLPACIDSILNQSFGDFQLILVDDGSPDRCWEICQAYAQKDSRILAFRQENQGQAAARNQALKKATGTWLCYVDSDDMIHRQMLETLYRAVQENQAQMAMCRMLEASQLPSDFSSSRQPQFSSQTLDDETMAQLYDRGEYPAWEACAKLIRRDLVERYPFTQGRIYEDNEAVCRWAAGAKLVRTQEPMYFYRTNPNSTTKSQFSMKKLDFLWALDSMIQFYGTIGFFQTRERLLGRLVDETAEYHRLLKAIGEKSRARSIYRDLRHCLRREGYQKKLTKAQREHLLDARCPSWVMKLYWPAEGFLRVLHQQGVSGLVRKLGKQLGKGREP